MGEKKIKGLKSYTIFSKIWTRVTFFSSSFFLLPDVYVFHEKKTLESKWASTRIRFIIFVVINILGVWKDILKTCFNSILMYFFLFQKKNYSTNWKQVQKSKFGPKIENWFKKSKIGPKNRKLVKKSKIGPKIEIWSKKSKIGSKSEKWSNSNC